MSRKNKYDQHGNGHSAIRTRRRPCQSDNLVTRRKVDLYHHTMGDKTESGTTYWADHLNVIDTIPASASILTSAQDLEMQKLLR